MSIWGGLIPTRLLDKGAVKEVIGYIKSFPVSSIMKKQMFIEWCREVGYDYTKEEIIEIVGEEREKYLKG